MALVRPGSSCYIYPRHRLARRGGPSSITTNILPIPALDGGKLLFVVIELVRGGKRVPPDKENLVHLIGFVVLIGLILWISAIDIGRIVQGVSPLGG